MQVHVLKTECCVENWQGERNMLYVRADGNAKIGAGHLMRCLTIIEAYVQLKGSSDNVMFVCADELSAELVRERGFQAKVLGTDYRDMESEISGWASMFSNWNGFGRREECRGPLERPRSTILVDSYYVTAKYLRELQSFGTVILLDDMQQEAYSVDVVVNYNVFAEEASYRELYRGNAAQFCIGGDFVPIRKQFLGREYEVADQVKDILITTGGGDVDNIAGEILQAIYTPKVQYHMVIGRFNPHRESLERLAKEAGNVQLHMDVKDMAGLMEQCDLAITAGGTTIYELAAMGIPFICFSYAENQEALTEYLGKQQVACFAGAYHKEPQQVLQQMKLLTAKMCGDYEARKICSQQEKMMIDGKGAERLAQMLQARE